MVGHLNKPSIQALIHGLNRHYYSIAISYRKSELEEKMLMNLHKKGWTHGLKTAGSTLRHEPFCCTRWSATSKAQSCPLQT